MRRQEMRMDMSLEKGILRSMLVNIVGFGILLVLLGVMFLLVGRLARILY